MAETQPPQKLREALNQSKDYVIIEGVTDSGKKLRPSDWVDRLAGLAAEYGPDRRLRYSKQLRTTTVNGQKCLRLELNLKESNEPIYDMVVCFAEENQLRVTTDVAGEAATQTCDIDPDAELNKKAQQ